MPQSKLLPTEPDMCIADMFQLALMRLDDEEWDSYTANKLVNSDGPVVTGDPLIDELERELWERSKETDNGYNT